MLQIALAKNPANRYASASELYHALASFVSEDRPTQEVNSEAIAQIRVTTLTGEAIGLPSQRPDAEASVREKIGRSGRMLRRMVVTTGVVVALVAGGILLVPVFDDAGNNDRGQGGNGRRNGGQGDAGAESLPQLVESAAGEIVAETEEEVELVTLSLPQTGVLNMLSDLRAEDGGEGQSEAVAGAQASEVLELSNPVGNLDSQPAAQSTAELEPTPESVSGGDAAPESTTAERPPQPKPEDDGGQGRPENPDGRNGGENRSDSERRRQGGNRRGN